MLLWHVLYWQINNTSASPLSKLYMYIVWTTGEKTVVICMWVCQGVCVYVQECTVHIVCVHKNLIPCKTVCRKLGSTLAQTGSRATLGLAASSGERVPIQPHTAVRHGGLNTSLHCDPINFISARHTFRHARSIRRGSGGLNRVEVSVWG